LALACITVTLLLLNLVAYGTFAISERTTTYKRNLILQKGCLVQPLLFPACPLGGSGVFIGHHGAVFGRFPNLWIRVWRKLFTLKPTVSGISPSEGFESSGDASTEENDGVSEDQASMIIRIDV
jgi:hypothetical protein